MPLRMSDDVRRFIFALPSVPHLEAILLMRRSAGTFWQADALAKHLYISEEQAARLLKDLCMAGICADDPAASACYSYRPDSAELARLIDRLSDFYARNIIEVTNIIHANAPKNQSKKIQQFADAFRLRKE